MRIDKDVSLENSTDVTNLLVDEFRIIMENNGGDELWINENNKGHNN